MPFEPYIVKDLFFQEFRFDFHIANEAGKAWYGGGQNQWMPEREWCVAHIRKGMTVVDCGAHHGMLSTIFAKSVGPDGKVFAYEALPSNAATIVKNMELNGLSNVEVRAVGVGEECASLPINHNMSNIVLLDKASGQVGSEFVTIVRLDDDLPSGTRVDLIKIDVEGHDLQALRGMPLTLTQRPIIDLELHNFIFADRASTLEAILNILRPLGYRWSLLGEIFDAPIELGSALDTDRIARFDNPHLFGLPT